MTTGEKWIVGSVGVAVVAALIVIALIVAGSRGPSVPDAGGDARRTGSAEGALGAETAGAGNAGSREGLAVLSSGAEASDVRVAGSPSGAADGAPAAAEAPKTGAVTGRVVDRELEPIAGVTVTATREAFLFRGGASRTASLPTPVETDENGAYRIDIGFADPFTLRFEHPGFAEETRRGVRGRPTEMVILEDIELGPGGAVAGKVVDRRGRPVAGAGILVEPHHDDISIPITQRLHLGKPKGFTDDDGTFRLEHLLPGRYDLVADESRFALADHGPVEIEEGKTVTGIEMVLDEGKEIRGRVVGPDGAPVADADVRVSVGMGDLVTIAGAGEIDLPSDPRHQAITAPDGSFRIGGLGAGSYTVSARRKGFSRGTTGPVEAGSEGVVVELKRNGSIRGRVVDARTGKPVRSFSAGARVDAGGPFVFSFGPNGGGSSSRSREFEDADGVFVLDDIAPGTYRVDVRARGYAEESVEEIVVDAGRETDIPPVALPPGAVLEGVVLTAAARQPVEGARMRATREVPPDEQEQQFSGIFISGDSGGAIELGTRGVTTETDEAGRFRFDDLEAGTYTVEMNHPLHVREKIPGIPVDPDVPGEPLEILVRLGGGIEGTVFDADGYPQAGAKVQVQGEKGFFERIVSDGLGNYQIGGLDPGTYHVKLVPKENQRGSMVFSAIRIDGGSNGPESFLPVDGSPVPVREGEVARLDLFDRVKGSVLGTVREAGAVVPDLAVGIQRGGGFFAMPTTDTTDRDGRYEFDELEPGEYVVTVSSPEEGREIFRRKIEVREGQRHDLDIDLPTAFIEGTVLSRRGRDPIEGARVTLQGKANDGDQMRIVVGMGEERQLRTDSEGRFRIPRVSPGEYTLKVMKEGFTQDTRGGIEVIEGEGVRDLEILLESGCSVTGIVRNPVDDVPVAFTQVVLLDAAGVRMPDIDPQFTRQDGRFRIDGLAPGSYVIRCHRMGFDSRDESIRVREGETAEVTIELRPTQ